MSRSQASNGREETWSLDSELARLCGIYLAVSAQINVVCAASWQTRQGDGMDRLYSCRGRSGEGMVRKAWNEMEQLTMHENVVLMTAGGS